jgi:hypothetical protein
MDVCYNENSRREEYVMAVGVIFVEILFTGLQASIWFALILIAIFGTSWLDLNALKGWENLATLIVLAISYALGVMIDRVSDSLFSPLDHKLRKKIIPDKDAPVKEMRLFLISKDDGTSKLLEYTRSRLRTARSTTVNIFCLFIGLIAYRVMQQSSVFNMTTVFLLAVSIVGMAISYYSWQRHTKTYYLRLAQAYRVVIRMTEQEDLLVKDDSASTPVYDG